MKTFGQILLFTVCLAIASTASAADPPTWGAQAGIFDGDFGFGARKDIVLGGDIHQITAQGAVYFQHRTTFRLDADYHFVIKAGGGRFYPLAGLDLALNSDGVQLGANGGGGVKFMLTKALAAFAEVKYVFGTWDGWAINGGVYF